VKESNRKWHGGAKGGNNLAYENQCGNIVSISTSESMKAVAQWRRQWPRNGMANNGGVMWHEISNMAA
jgi:hypothetical protein